MRIAGVCTAYHEADILPWTIRHLFANGINEVWIECPIDDEDTKYAALEQGARVIQNLEKFHDQPASIKALADRAEVDWIIPFDADEFVCASFPPQTIRQALEAIPENVAYVTVPSYKHRNWWYREVGAPSMPKVAYRYSPDIRVGPGNHHIIAGLPEGSLVLNNGLMIREIQYRNFEHFQRKVEERCRTIDPSFGPEMGHHIRQFEDFTITQLRDAWYEMLKTPVVWDPIPSSIDPPSHLAPKLMPAFSMDVLLDQMRGEPNDIAGHLKRLTEVVKETGTDRVIECGVCTGMSTIAFLSTGVKVESYDMGNVRVRPEVWNHSNWTLRVGNDLEWNPEPCKVIFIDTTHEYRQSLEELKHFWPLVLPGGCMIFHDTVSYVEEARAIRHWLHTVDDVESIEHFTHDNGLDIFWKSLYNRYETEKC